MQKNSPTAFSSIFKPLDPRQTLRMQRYFMSAGTSLLVIFLLFACYLEGVLSRAAFYQSTALVSLGIVTFYILLRSGLNLKFSDPSLTVPQMLSSTLVILYTMYAADGGRAVFLVLLLMIFLFGVLRLATRTLLAYAAVILGAHGMVIGLLWRFKPQSLDLRLELLQWLALAITLPWFAAMGGFISGLRKKATAARATLVDAIESLSEAFCLFDADDRLVLCNRKYAQIFSDSDQFEDIAGMRFEDLVRLTLTKGEVIEPEFQNDVEAWVTEQIRRHRNPNAEPHLLQLGDGRWLQVTDRHTQNGGIVGVRRDISESKAYEYALSNMANSDALTALPNRHWLMGFLPLAIERARVSNTILALLFVDLDDFKNINDTMGHPAGDELLKAAAARLRSVIRPTDHVVRLGGDEFTIILEHPENATAVQRVSDRIIAALREPFLLAGQSSHVVSASIGISTFPQDGDDADTLLKHADIAMYATKANGKAGYQFFQPQLSQNLVVRLSNEQALRTAIDADEFVLYYQPRVDTASGELRSFEALVRWIHPQRGLIRPDEFIPLAEETGLIVALGEMVIEKACAQLAKWQAANLPLAPVSINVSLRQFDHGNLAELFDLYMRRYGIAPSLIEIELTESCMMGEDHALFDQLGAIKLLGVKLLLDDFGTGYSSLSQLQRLDLNILKVDKAFTAQLGNSKKGEAFFRAIISMAHALNMIVVAEGVETLEQLRILQALACDEIQGYFVSRPLPAGEISQLMRKRYLFPEGAIALPVMLG